ncbi:oxidative stress-induced growth inhibitor 1-like [Glandiceps talaboti]
MAAVFKMDDNIQNKKDIWTTDVAIIGNGPSAICLSFLLSGYWPYYNGKPHPTPHLQRKLSENPDISIIEKDLEYLSDGLEGRSSNPVALLYDALHHPNADTGSNAMSCLDWKHSKDNAIPHVVLGRGLPGGVWQNMENSKLTLSLKNWMEMPGLSFEDWLRCNHEQEDIDGENQERASFSDVFQYYTDYVDQMNIRDNFLSHVNVKSVRRIRGQRINNENGENENMPEIGYDIDKYSDNLFEVICEQIDEVEGRASQFKIHARNVVLATGTSDLPNRLGVPGDDRCYVKSNIQDLELAIERGHINSNSDPVVIIGAGLSAADAILCAHNNNIPIVHIIRRDVHDSGIMLKQLLGTVYPEYHKVYKMMVGEIKCPGTYQCYDKQQVEEFKEDNTIVISGPKDCRYIKVSMVMAMTGAKPNLSYLCCNGQSLGVNPKIPITCKSNPIAIDYCTHESVTSPGMFAMGPLVGDNFVRFLKGGALAITRHLTRRKYLQKDE